MKKLFIAMILMIFSTTYAKDAYVIEINGIISGASHKFIKKSIETSEKENAAYLIIKLDTPGGVLESTRQIVKEIFESRIPIVVYVSPQGAVAGSAGSFITLAANYAVMTDSATIGAAHPVMSNGGDIEGDMRQKITNITESLIKNIAEKRNRDIKQAVLIVSESKSFTASEALKANLIDYIANTDEELINILSSKLENNENLSLKKLVPTTLEKIEFTLADPNLMTLLLLSAILLIFLEIKIPGSFIFGGMGAVAAILFLIGANIIPINKIGLILIIIGAVFIILELFITSFGILTIAGISSYIGGLSLLFKTDAVQGIKVSLWIMITTAALIVFIILFIGRLIIKDFKRKPELGLSGLIDKNGLVIQWKKNKGKVKVQGEIWDAISSNELSKDDEVTIKSADGLILKVEKKF